MNALKPRLLGTLAALLVALPAVSQVGHPVKGSWSGYWGPTDDERHRILLVLDWEDRQISGVVNPGRNAVRIDRAELDVETWTLRLEAEMPKSDGTKAAYVLTGTLDNLGSWHNRRYLGTYRHGDETGTFLVTLN